MASIEAQNVCKTYPGRDGGVVALDNVSLKVTDSEFVSILGPSGCGKSTLLRILDGLAKADSGTLLMDGRPIERPTQERGFVFQSFNLFPWRTVRSAWSSWWDSRDSSASIRTSFPAACSSAWASRARSRSIPRCC